MENDVVLRRYELALKTIKMRPATVGKRFELLRRLVVALDGPLLSASPDDLSRFQATIGHLAPASVDIYTRHAKAFYAWAAHTGLIDEDPAAWLEGPILRKGQPHPTQVNDLRMILKCAPSTLWIAYVLAAFVGLRAGEICRLRYEDLDLDAPAPSAAIDGKGGKQRTVPLIAPIVRELRTGRRGWVLTNRLGRPMTPAALSVASSKFLHELGMTTTLHSMRHFYGTWLVRLTKDPLLVRNLMGHESVATTEIYMEMDMSGAHQQLATFADMMGGILGGGPVRDAAA